MRLLLVMLCLLASSSVAVAADLPQGFDPQRHMLVSEVRPGMKGYGLSVFSGTKIEKFNVEVISTLKNFNPRQDVVLIRVSGCNLEHTGAIAGMSGSPVYLQDQSGKSRLIGAFAYGWPMMKDPLAGVQPIEYMLSIPLASPATVPSTQRSVTLAPAASSSWSALAALDRLRATPSRPPSPTPLSSSRLTPMAIPLSISGSSAAQIDALSPLFARAGLAPLQAGGGSGDDADIPVQPGSVLAVPLLTGDSDMTAVGTCTEVLDGKVYGFGHPFTGEGPLSLPMCGGRINGVIANLVTSFKLGAASRPIGSLLADHVSGVAGRLGAVPITAPIRLRVTYADRSLDQTYTYRAVVHPQFTPLLASSAVFSSLSASRQLPRHNTVDFSMRVAFNDGHEVKLSDKLANVDPGALFAAIGAPIGAITENPFSDVLVKEISGDVRVYDGSDIAELLHAGLPRQTCRPGETVKFFATVRPFRSVERVKELAFKLPDDLPDGQYSLVVSDLARYVTDERAASPFRFTAGTIEQAFTAINELSSLRSDALYLRLVRNDPAVAIGRTSLPRIPGSQRQLLLSAGRSDVVAFAPSNVEHVPTDWVMSGAIELSINVSKEGALRPPQPPSPSPPAPHLPPHEVKN